MKKSTSKTQLETPQKKRPVGRPKTEKGAMSGMEKQRRKINALVKIDEQLNQARNEINWERRKHCEADIVDWVNTYCKPSILQDSPPEKCQQILRDMLEASLDNKPYLLQIARGAGKTSFCECIVAYLIATGRKKFAVIVSHNQTSAQGILSDLFRLMCDDGTAFATDYPDIALPFILCNGQYRRTQTYNNKVCGITTTANHIIFARLEDEQNNPYPTSESVIETRGISSGLRGLKYHDQRPDLVLLDDIQDEEMAESGDRIAKTLNIIYKSVFNLGGKNKISILQTGTPIASDDLVEQLANDKAWKTSKYPAFFSFPTDYENAKDTGLWSEYFAMFDSEIATDSDHSKSLEFYKKNQDAMDKGATVLNPLRYDEENGQITAIQFLMDKLHQIGESAFYSEYQMTPKKVSIEVQLKPKQILEHIGTYKEDVVPNGCTFTVAALDLNTSFGATITICSFKPDSSCFVIKHKIFRMCIDQALTDTLYDQQLYAKLSDTVRAIKEWGIDLDALVIDAGGRNWNCVMEFTKNCQHRFQIPCCAIAGRSSLYFNPLAKNRLRNAVGKTVLCGDEAERTKKGTGHKWVWIDSDYYREMVQKSFMLELGSPGSTTLYLEVEGDHIEFATQVTNETLQFKRQTAKGIEYHWKSKDPHDYLDTMAYCFACAENQGINSVKILQETNKPSKKAQLIKHLLKKKPVKIV